MTTRKSGLGEGDLKNLAHGHAVVDGEEGAGHGRGPILAVGRPIELALAEVGHGMAL